MPGVRRAPGWRGKAWRRWRRVGLVRIGQDAAGGAGLAGRNLAQLRRAIWSAHRLVVVIVLVPEGGRRQAVVVIGARRRRNALVTRGRRRIILRKRGRSREGRSDRQRQQK